MMEMSHSPLSNTAENIRSDMLCLHDRAKDRAGSSVRCVFFVNASDIQRTTRAVAIIP